MGHPPVYSYLVVLSPRNEASAGCRHSPRTPRGGEGSAKTNVLNGNSAIPILSQNARKDGPTRHTTSVRAQRLHWIRRSGSKCRENTGGRGASPERMN